MNALEFHDVSFSYRDQVVLDGVDFHVEKGEFVAILGPNGAGKSTTLRLANGLLRPQAGTVRSMGLDTATNCVSDIARHVGFLFQNPDRQICCNTVREEVAFGLRTLYPGDPQRIGRRTEEILELLHLDGSLDPFNLARGQRQVVALAGLMAVDPELMLLDEPTTGLDYSECMEIMHDIQVLNEAGTTVVMVCHDMEVVLDFASRVIVLAEGHVLADGATREVFQQQDALTRASLLPPQICELSQRLAPAHPGLGGIYTADEMADAIASLVGGE